MAIDDPDDPQEALLVSGDRALLQRLAFYEVVQRDETFATEVQALFHEVATWSRTAREASLSSFVARWNLPMVHGVGDIDTAFRWRIQSSDSSLANGIDLVLPHRMIQPLKGLARTRTVNIETTLSFLYNPVWDYHSDAIEELNTMLNDFRHRALGEMKAVEREARTNGLAPMPKRWRREELHRLAVRLYQHAFQGMTWGRITDEEIKKRHRGPEELGEESVRKSASAFARRIGVSARRARRPPT